MESKKVIKFPSPVSTTPECTIEPWLDDPFPDYDTEPVPIYANN